MSKIPLQEFCKTHGGQKAAAAIIGCTQGNISQMISAGREIFFEKDGDSFSWMEIKRRSKGGKAKRLPG